mmetsp:Transcript_10857/g.21831  ORF Transcript_10857/g.21831 Transcript_10857/m.21831 type:complete len:82 (-) Transcript_10857:61-306(-)
MDGQRRGVPAPSFFRRCLRMRNSCARLLFSPAKAELKARKMWNTKKSAEGTTGRLISGEGVLPCSQSSSQSPELAWLTACC